MNIVKLILKSPKNFRLLTGLTPEVFQTMLAKFEPLWVEARRKHQLKKKRKRAPGAGHPFFLTPDEMLFLYLIYHYVGLPYTHLSEIFGIHPSNICRNFKLIFPIISDNFEMPNKEVVDTDKLNSMLKEYASKVSKPTIKPAAKNAATGQRTDKKPFQKPSHTKPALKSNLAKPVAKPTAKPVAKPAAKPTPKPVAKPAAKPTPKVKAK